MSSYDDDRPVNMSDLLDEYLKDLKTGKAQKEARQRENVFRRGYLHGFDMAIECLSHLLDHAVSRDLLYSYLARLENEVVMPWRNDLRTFDTPELRATIQAWFSAPPPTPGDDESEEDGVA